MFSAGSITVCSGLSSSGAHGQENHEKQVMVGATLLVLPVQLLLVSSSPRKHPCSPAFWWEQLVSTVLAAKRPGLTASSGGHLCGDLVFLRW